MMDENMHLGDDLRRDAQEKAKPLHASGRSVGFYVETVCVVLLLFLVLGIVVQFYGKAFVATTASEGTMQGATTARQVAELFQGADTPEQFAQMLDAKLEPAADATAAAEWWDSDTSATTAATGEAGAGAAGSASIAALGTVSAQVEYVAGSPVDVSVDVAGAPQGAGTLYGARILVHSEQDPTVDFTLVTKHYVHGGGAQ